ncbi:signal transduction histidine kinase [Marmoricola sp. URHA0025 HA25]
MRSSRVQVAGLAGLSLALVLMGCGLLVAEQLERAHVAYFAGVGGIGALTVALGLVVTWRVGGNVVGVLLTWVGFGVVCVAARDVYEHAWLADPGGVPLSTTAVAVLDESAWWLFAGVALLLLHFPDGRLPGPRWRAVPGLVLGSALVTHVASLGAGEPFIPPLQDRLRPWAPFPSWVQLLGAVANVTLVALVLAAAASTFVRFRRSTGRTRAQLKWLSLAGIGIAAYPLVCVTELALTGSTDRLALVVGLASLVLLPGSVAIALLRHDLYDVDRVLADTISYVVVVVALLATYALASFGLGLVAGRNSAVAAAGATAVCALLLAPARVRLRRSVDHRLFPRHRAALGAVEDLRNRVHTDGARPEDLEAVLRTALRDPELRVGVLVPGSAGFVDTTGAAVAGTALVPVMLGGVQVGVMTGAESNTGVLRLVAPSCASLVEVIRLRAELASALREVEASRARLVHVGDAERKRLERDLHDGAQQRLVSLGMAMRVAQRRLPGGTVDVHGLLDQGVAELAIAVAELRQIAHGLRPSSLDDGLHAALSALTSALPIPVHLEVPTTPIDEQLATTAYFVAAEAMANAAKHAHASAIKVRVANDPSGVCVRIQDDGVGGAVPRVGSGLAGLADRVSAVGGSLVMTSIRGSGTTIEAVLPCGS